MAVSLGCYNGLSRSGEWQGRHNLLGSEDLDARVCSICRLGTEVPSEILVNLAMAAVCLYLRYNILPYRVVNFV